MFSDHTSAIVLSFRARIGASGPRTCRLHSYEASGRLQCSVATLIVRTGLLFVCYAAEALCECFLTIPQQWHCQFRARIGASGPCTCHLCSYKAGGS